MHFDEDNLEQVYVQFDEVYEEGVFESKFYLVPSAAKELGTALHETATYLEELGR